MKTAYLRGGEISDRMALHQALATQLDFPAYYGNNLDAMYDVLTSVSEPVEIVLTEADALWNHLGPYSDLFRTVLTDICRDNPAVAFREEQEEDALDQEAL